MNPEFSHDSQHLLLLEGPVGALEVLTTFPQKEAAKYVAIICHPHPLYQGAMNNKVVTTLAKSVMATMPTVRFNFRGVGNSEGGFAEGVGEQDDLRTVLAWAQQQLPQHEVVLMGFSFGAFVAASVANGMDLAYLLTVAPAVRCGNFNALNAISCPWTVIYGDQDEVVSVDDIRALVQQPPSSIIHAIELPGVTHFFHGKLIELRELVEQDVARVLHTV